MENWIVYTSFGIILLAFVIAIIVAVYNFRIAKKYRIKFEEQERQVDFLRARATNQKQRDSEVNSDTFTLRNQLQHAISERDRIKQERDQLELERNEFYQEILRLNSELEKASEYANLVGTTLLKTNEQYASLLKDYKELEEQLMQTKR